MKLEIVKMPKMLTLHINANNDLIYKMLKMLSNAHNVQNAKMNKNLNARKINWINEIKMLNQNN